MWKCINVSGGAASCSALRTGVDEGKINAGNYLTWVIDVRWRRSGHLCLAGLQYFVLCRPKKILCDCRPPDTQIQVPNRL